VPAIAPHTQTSPTVLPQRNLLRQLTWGLPSGPSLGADLQLGSNPNPNITGNRSYTWAHFLYHARW
jgi:hypothetical protein